MWGWLPRVFFGLVWGLVWPGVLAGCAGPVAGLWPQPPGAATVTVHVSVDRWHAMIALPAEGRGGPTAKFEEWGYAQRAWYLEGRQGVLDAVHALLWPTEGVVEVSLVDRLWADRTPQPPAEVFTFQLAPEGYRRLRAHLAESLAGLDPLATLGPARFYRARDDYHLFHTCHQWAARALRATGLPLSPGAAFTRAALAWQLARATRLASSP